MSTAQQIARTIHDVVNEGTTTVEDLHRSIAELPLRFLGSVEPFEQPMNDVRDVHARSIGAIYGLIRRVNDRVGQLAVEILPG